MGKEISSQSEPQVLENFAFPPELGLTFVQSGKTAEIWKDENGLLYIVRTDRVSVGDKVVGTIPHKGAANNLLSEYWMNRISDIIPSAQIDTPDPNVSIMKPIKIFPVEFVVRGFITGVTDTSLWMKYKSGRREIYGHRFPEGLQKNNRLPEPIITPTTKADLGLHDEEITKDVILKEGLLTPEQWLVASRATIEIYNRIYTRALSVGLVCMDMKLEFGENEEGKIFIGDEVGTCDSSRFALLETFNYLVSRDDEPQYYDKEFYRIIYKSHGSVLPPEVEEASRRYKFSYEAISGKKLYIPDYPVQARIVRNVENWLNN